MSPCCTLHVSWKPDSCSCVLLVWHWRAIYNSTIVFKHFKVYISGISKIMQKHQMTGFLKCNSIKSYFFSAVNGGKSTKSMQTTLWHLILSHVQLPTLFHAYCFPETCFRSVQRPGHHYWGNKTGILANVFSPLILG